MNLNGRFVVRYNRNLLCINKLPNYIATINFLEFKFEVLPRQLKWILNVQNDVIKHST